MLTETQSRTADSCNVVAKQAEQMIGAMSKSEFLLSVAGAIDYSISALVDGKQYLELAALMIRQSGLLALERENDGSTERVDCCDPSRKHVFAAKNGLGVEWVILRKFEKPGQPEQPGEFIVEILTENTDSREQKLTSLVVDLSRRK